MHDEAQRRDERTRGAPALKVRIAAASTTAVVVSLAVVPEAFARIALNHTETVLALTGAPADEA